jgi:hypothetical protein
MGATLIPDQTKPNQTKPNQTKPTNQLNLNNLNEAPAFRPVGKGITEQNMKLISRP